jgi:hypothetical protein
MLNGLLRKLQLGAVVLLSVSAIADDRSSSDIPRTLYDGRLQILRHQKDVSRDRGWILTPRGVAVFDYRTRQTTAFVNLPEWIWIGEAFMCPPDLALGPKGEAIISSNLLPSLWRIDPVSLRVTKHDLALDADTGKDVGFTGLTYSQKLGVFFAITDVGTLWRIDPLFRRAQKIAVNEFMPRACGLTSLNTRRTSWRVGLCVRTAAKNWTVFLSPDQRSASVRQDCS